MSKEAIAFWRQILRLFKGMIKAGEEFLELKEKQLNT